MEFLDRFTAFSVGDDTISLRAATDDDSRFFYETKRAALGDYVSRTWGWEEEFQRAYHRKHYDPQAAAIIVSDHQNVGCLVVRDEPNYILLESVYLLPEYQNRGIGGRIVADILRYATAESRPVRLHVLKINPAIRLYKRLDFRIIGETGHHYVMEWSNPPNSAS